MAENGFTLVGESQTRAGQMIAQISGLAQQASGGPHPNPPGFVSAMARKVGSQHRVSKAVLEDVVIWTYEHGLTLGAVWNTVERGLGTQRCAKLRRKCEKIAQRLQDECDAAVAEEEAKKR